MLFRSLSSCMARSSATKLFGDFSFLGVFDPDAVVGVPPGMVNIGMAFFDCAGDAKDWLLDC
mgnify:FL=1